MRTIEAGQVTYHKLAALHELLVNNFAGIVFPGLDVYGFLDDCVRPASEGFSRAVLQGNPLSSIYHRRRAAICAYLAGHCGRGTGHRCGLCVGVLGQNVSERRAHEGIG